MVTSPSHRHRDEAENRKRQGEEEEEGKQNLAGASRALTAYGGGSVPGIGGRRAVAIPLTAMGQATRAVSANW